VKLIKLQQQISDAVSMTYLGPKETLGVPYCNISEQTSNTPVTNHSDFRNQFCSPELDWTRLILCAIADPSAMYGSDEG